MFDKIYFLLCFRYIQERKVLKTWRSGLIINSQFVEIPEEERRDQTYLSDLSFENYIMKKNIYFIRVPSYTCSLLSPSIILTSFHFARPKFEKRPFSMIS